MVLGGDLIPSINNINVINKVYMKTRTIIVAGFEVEVCTFGKKSFYYPSFNGNAEFVVSSKGFRDLSHYLRSVRYFEHLVFNCL